MKASHWYLKFFFLFALPFLTSCKGQKKTDPPKGNTQQATQSIINPSDIDPYFTETQAITSAYGPSSITRNIIQDRKGNFWLATWEGIVRYDGNSLTFFKKNRLETKSLFGIW